MLVPTRCPRSLVFMLVAVAASALTPPAVAQGTVVETGFRMRHFGACASGSPGQTIQISDAECSPGGAWGDFVYYAVFDLSDERNGRVERMAPNGHVFGFLGQDIPTSMAFSAPQGPFEDRLWVNDTLFTAGMNGVNPPLGLAPLFTCAKPGIFTFDPTGAFGFHMFVRGPDGIYRLEAPACDPALPPPYVLFATTDAAPLRFGPGGPWGADLYATGGEIFAPDGSSTTFPFPFTEITWGFGTRWNGDMFARQAGSDDIYRVRPDGTSSLFATGFFGDMVFCGDSLWIMRTGDCLKITARGPR